MVCVEEERYGDLCVLDSLYEIVSFLRRADACHVLDSDGVNAHALKFLAHFNVLLDCMYR